MELSLTTELKQLITARQAWHYQVIPKEMDASGICLLTHTDAPGAQLQDELELLLGKAVSFDYIESTDLKHHLAVHYRQAAATAVKKVQRADGADYLHSLVQEARELGSSDIHIEVYEERARVRIRVDGRLLEQRVLDQTTYPSFVNKIKIKSNLDISEKRRPQDGRMIVPMGTDKIELRVSVLPTLYGEKIVLRILQSDVSSIDLATLGLREHDLDRFTTAVRKPNGIILVSGPTGSGKTTTLYATLKMLNSVDRNIVTIEDPIEYTLQGINQVQVKEQIGLTFAAALRSILRQDPDIIMLGEIRDKETAEMAVRAALTGHLVLSTIHTNSAWGTITRLQDMGIPSYLIESTLNLSAAQRLARLLCDHCKEPVDAADLSPELRSYVQDGKGSFYRSVGCPQCHYSGYKGRVAIYEIIPINESFADLIRQGISRVNDLQEEHGIQTLQQSALDLVREGKTTLEEIYPILLEAR